MIKKTFHFLVVAGFFLLVGCHQARILSAVRPPPILSVLSPQDLSEIQKVIYFDPGQWVPEQGQQDLIEKKADILKKHHEIFLILEGHADIFSSIKYNQELGDRRARKLKWELTQHGIAHDRLSIVSFGKARPKCLGNSLSDYRCNRRVEFLIK